MLEQLFTSLGRASIEPALVFSVVFWMVFENWRPFRPAGANAAGHALNNLALTALNHGLMLWLTPWLYLACMGLLGDHWQDWLASEEVGFAGSFAITLLASELLSYWMHRVFHAVPWLWRVHAVHHSDTETDVTTAHRHHPIEVLVGSISTLLLLLLLGPSQGVVLAYSLFRLSTDAFSHANISLPEPLDRRLSLIVVTPNFHRLHHMADVRYTNSNYGSVLPWFDALFGTRRALPAEQARAREYGLEYFRKAKDSRLDRLLTMPFSSGFPKRPRDGGPADRDKVVD